MTNSTGIPEYWHDFILEHAFEFTLKQFSQTSKITTRKIKQLIHDHRYELKMKDVYWKEFIFRMDCSQYVRQILREIKNHVELPQLK